MFNMVTKSTFAAGLFALLLNESSAAFHASLSNRALKHSVNNGMAIFAGPSASEAAERLRQQAADRAMLEQEGPPMLFDDDMLADMQQTLLTLEKRVRDGPGSLTHLEIEQLSARLNKISEEMKANEHKRPEKPKRKTVEELEGATVVSTPVKESPQPPPAAEPSAPPKIVDISNDEGPEWDGKGGMGQPRGTRNTYAIPGMEKMTPDEYRKALETKVSETARERRMAGRVGSQQSSDYLSFLNKKTEENQKGNDEGEKKNYSPFKK